MSAIDEAFFDAYQSCCALTTVWTARTPEDMVAGEVDPDGWIAWRLVSCDASVMKATLTALEREAGVHLPPSFRRWYGSRHTLDMDLSVVRLPTNPSNDPAGPLRQRLLAAKAFARPREIGLIPFGDEANDAGPLCFDPRAGGHPDSWPILYWDHDWAGTEREIGPVLFSSFDRLLIACTALLRRLEERRRNDPGSHPWEAHRADCIRALMEADPEGAGGPGRTYWVP
jgi:hypothetical protein